MEKKKKRKKTDGTTEARWNDISVFSLDLYRAKMKILLPRLYSFTGRRIKFNKGRLNRSKRRFSFDVARMHAHTWEKKMSDYWEYIRWNACPRNGTFHSSNGDNIVPNSKDWVACSLFFLFSLFLPLLAPPTLNNGIWNTGNSVCPSPFCRRYSFEMSIKSRWFVISTNHCRA